MRKTLCALALTLILSVATMAGEIPNGGNTPPPPPPPPPADSFGEIPNGRPANVQTSDEMVKDYILIMIKNVLALY